MHVDAPVLALGAGDDVECPIAVEIGEYGVLGLRRGSDGHGRPGFANLRRTGMPIDAGHAALLPARRDIDEPVAIDVRDLHAIGIAATVVDDVHEPGGAARCGAAVKGLGPDAERAHEQDADREDQPNRFQRILAPGTPPHQSPSFHQPPPRATKSWALSCRRWPLACT